MSGVRVLVGTRKGAFVLTADGRRKDWAVEGPFFAGWEIYHMKGSPADSNRIYVSQTSGWFGQLLQRSDDGGIASLGSPGWCHVFPPSSERCSNCPNHPLVCET